MVTFMKKRSSGILLHITSLPSKYGVGDLGPSAYKFADFLAQAKQRYWQVLPLNPPAIAIPHSPYNCLSAYAGNPMLISPKLLHKQGLLAAKEIQNVPDFPQSQADYQVVIPHKTNLLNTAYTSFKSKPQNPQYQRFCMENKSWLEDFAMYVALRQYFRPKMWCDWPPELRDRNNLRQESLSLKLQDDINREKFLQFQFFKQWFSLKHYCNERDIRIIGDIPIYVSFDSADLWANSHFFKLTRKKKPKVISGVPPDFFSKTGQLWGNPIYDWPALKKTGYSWWIQRIGHNLKLFDVIRLDHFRAFVAYWQVPANHKTAAKGRWIRAPKESFFRKLFQHFPSCPIIVEDLGHITPAVKASIEKFKLSDMRILTFGFDGDKNKNVHFINNHVKNSVVYTGTHDNNTLIGWFEKEAGPVQKRKLFDSLRPKVSPAQLNWELIKLAMSSRANLAIIAMQDILGLGQHARMNLPGSIAKENWTWRLDKNLTTSSTISKLKEITEKSNRA